SSWTRDESVCALAGTCCCAVETGTNESAARRITGKRTLSRKRSSTSCGTELNSNATRSNVQCRLAAHASRLLRPQRHPAGEQLQQHDAAENRSQQAEQRADEKI